MSVGGCCAVHPESSGLPALWSWLLWIPTEGKNCKGYKENEIATAHCMSNLASQDPRDGETCMFQADVKGSAQVNVLQSKCNCYESPDFYL